MKRPKTSPEKKNAIGVYAETQQVQEQAQSVAHKLQIPLLENSEDATLVVWLNTFGIGLLQTEGLHAKKQKPFFIDFLDKEFRYRLRTSKRSQELLLKAIGLSSSPLSVFDATAGTATETFLMAAFGCQVTAVERSPILAELVQDGLKRATQEETFLPILQNIHFSCGESRSLWLSSKTIPRPEVIYLDPMFPERKKSALVKKEMLLLRQLVGEDQDASELFQVALTLAQKRVVVKRPNYAPPLSKSPNFSYSGKHTRFDIYLI